MTPLAMRRGSRWSRRAAWEAVSGTLVGELRRDADDRSQAERVTKPRGDLATRERALDAQVVIRVSQADEHREQCRAREADRKEAAKQGGLLHERGRAEQAALVRLAPPDRAREIFGLAVPRRVGEARHTGRAFDDRDERQVMTERDVSRDVHVEVDALRDARRRAYDEALGSFPAIRTHKKGANVGERGKARANTQLPLEMRTQSLFLGTEGVALGARPSGHQFGSHMRRPSSRYSLSV